jgi:hypothetical protein
MNKLALANAWMHGLDLQLIRTDAPLPRRCAYGLAGVSVVGFVIGVLYAAAYNCLPPLRRNGG